MDLGWLAQGVQAPQLPNPLQMAVQGMTLQELGQKTALTNLQTQQVQRALDTQTAAAQVYADAQTMGWDAARAKAIREGNILGAQVSLQAQRADEGLQADLALKKAQAGEATAKGNQADAAALKENLVSLGNAAGSMIDAVKAGSLDPGRAVSIVSFQAQKAGIDPRLLGISSTGPANPDPASVIAQLQTAGNNALSAADRIQMPGKLALTKAQTDEAVAHGGLYNVQAQYHPQEVQAKTTEAAAAARNAATAAAGQQYGRAETFQNPVTGQTFVFTPGNANAAPSVGAVGAQGSGEVPQTSMSAGQKAQQGTLEKRLQTASEGAQMAERIKQLVPMVQQALNAGNTGAYWGSDSGKALLNLVASTPGLKNVIDVNKLAQTNSADALIAELVGPLVHELNSRGSNASMRFIVANKPETMKTLEGNAAIGQALTTDANNLIAYNKALNTYVGKNPTDLGLTNFRAPTPAMPTKPTKGLQNTPTNAQGWPLFVDGNGNKAFVGPNGEIQEVK